MSFAFFVQPLTTDRILVPTSPDGYRPWSRAEGRSEVDRGPSNPTMGDSLILTVPWRSYNAEMLREGRLPFWNPHIFCGYPHLAALQSNALYPPVVLFDLWDPLRGIAWSMAVHMALAGSLMFLFLSRLGISRWSAILGAVLFEFNGFFLVRMGAPSYVFSGVWTPLLLVGLLEIARSGKWKHSWKIVVAVAMSFLGGHPQILVFMLLIGGVFFLSELVAQGSGTVRQRLLMAFRPALIAGVAVFIGFLLVGYQLVPFAELMGESGRSAVPYESFRKVGLPVFALIQAFVPDVFGHPVDGTYWGASVVSKVDPAPSAAAVFGFNYCGENLFTGVVPLVLALIGLFADRRRRVLLFGGIFTIVFLILIGTPAMRLFYLMVPVLRSSRPDRLVFVAMVAVTILSAYGCDALLNRGTRRRDGSGSLWIPISFIVVALSAVLWAVLVSPGWGGGYREAAEMIAARLSPLPSAVAWQGVANIVLGLAVPFLLVIGSGKRVRWMAVSVAAAAVLGPLFVFGWKFNPTQPQPFFPKANAEAVIRRLVPSGGRLARLNGARNLPSNTAQLVGLDDVNGSSAAGVGHYLDLIKAADSEAVRKDKYFRTFRDPRIVESPLLDLLGVRLLLSREKLPLSGERTISSKLYAYDRPSALPRYRFVDSVESYVHLEAARKRVVGRSVDHETTALVAEGSQAAEIPELPADAALGQQEVRVQSMDAHKVVLGVETDRRRLLVTSDVDYPGWVVEIDGVRSGMQRVNTAFRGVVVPAGRHVVEFRYVPRSFVAGCVVSLFGFAMMVSLQRATRRREKRDGTNIE